MPSSTVTISESSFFEGKKVLVFGLGLLGGGIATTNWLLKHRADVTVTDLKNEKQLASSLRRLKGEVHLHLGGHTEQDIYDNEVIVFNPDIYVLNEYVILAKKLGKIIENEATLFYQLTKHPIVAITGTRGKTTTTNWINHFLSRNSKTIMAGNSSNDPLMKMLDKIHVLESKNGNGLKGRKNNLIIVNELPSYHLELFNEIDKAPDIAVITNLFPDHLNRYLTLETYASIKANIFMNQNSDQHLILNYNNKWTPFFVNKKPRSKVWFFSMDGLHNNVPGVFFKDNSILFQDQKQQPLKVLDVTGVSNRYGEHNLENLLACSLAAHLAGVPWQRIQQELGRLPQIPFRQETILENSKIKIINDTTATTPEGSMVAIKRFGSSNCILITGGTDRDLDYSEWAEQTLNYIKPENIVMLSGSATVKMQKALGHHSAKTQVLDTLRECIRVGLLLASRYEQSILLFSPAAKSFEKFNNEMDRGKQFNRLIKMESQAWINH
jgi:UDP-N-acetylmuramoylalanine--D-glutamate ligase